MRGLSDRHRFRKGPTARRATAQKKPFVGGAGTYEGRRGEGAHPSRTVIIDNVFQKLNPSNGGSSKIFRPGVQVLWGGPPVERPTATCRRGRSRATSIDAQPRKAARLIGPSCQADLPRHHLATKRGSHVLRIVP